MTVVDQRLDSTLTVGGLFEAIGGAIETSLWRVWYDNGVAFYAMGGPEACRATRLLDRWTEVGYNVYANATYLQ